MLKHYIKVAFRNLWKYKTQSLISVIGLAVGFTCFALATLWIRYEMTYDAFHKNAKDIYYFNRNFQFSVGDLRKDYPEIKEVANLRSLPPPLGSDLTVLFTEKAALNMLDIHILDGQFPDPDQDCVAITEERAALLFGNENPIGKTIQVHIELTISAVVSGYSHSNFPFDVILPSEYGMGYDFIMLHPNVDFKAFHQKMRDRISQEYKGKNTTISTEPILIPLTEFRYKDPLKERSIKFEYIGLFALIGILVIICSLFNYITLFVARFRIRSKEFALRLVCGGSRSSLISLLTAEYLISLILAAFLGLLLVKILLPSFEELSEIRMGISDIYGELLLYFLLVLIVSLMAFWLAIGLLGKRTLQATIRKRDKQIFRKFSVVAQLFITIAMIFCSVVIIKQMHFLHNSSNIGFEVKNRARISSHSGNVGATTSVSFSLGDKLKQIPEVEEVIFGYMPLIPAGRGFLMSPTRASSLDGQPDENRKIMFQRLTISDEYIRFYDLQLVEGGFAGWDDSSESVLINESAAKAFGWDEAVGKRFLVESESPSPIFRDGKYYPNYGSPSECQVAGVLKNINNSSSVEATPYFYVSRKHNPKEATYSFLIKYKEGSWKIVLDKIKKIEEEYVPGGFISVLNSEEEYDKQFKSETSLMLILNFVSLVCVLISVFGFFSLIALNLEERRKEMAIRKVNGATPGNIMAIYFKEYFLLLLISSLIAFPVAYLVMKRWLEQYIQQTEISVWIYIVILFVIALVIALCTGWRIWRSSRENPVETLKMS